MGYLCTDGVQNELFFSQLLSFISGHPSNDIVLLRGHWRLVIVTTFVEFRTTPVFVDRTVIEDWISYSGTPVPSSTKEVFRKLFLLNTNVLCTELGSILSS